MARYIDADDIIKAIKNRFKVYHEIPCSQDDRRVQEIVGLVIRMIDEQPTADVVPKSEVEELNRECESLGKTVNEASELIRKLKGKVEQAKQEVAREIFAEIEEAHDECIWVDITTRIGYLQQTKFDHKLAELKEKYAGDQT